MDGRIALKKNDRLAFPGMECVIDAPAGQGSCVLAYTGSYPDRQDPHILHRVLIRELFPFDPSGGIYRTESGDLHISDSSEFFYSRCREAFLRANEVHCRMADRIPGDLDLHINTFNYHNTLYSVMGYSGGRTLSQEIERLFSRTGQSRTEQNRPQQDHGLSQEGERICSDVPQTGPQQSCGLSQKSVRFCSDVPQTGLQQGNGLSQKVERFVSKAEEGLASVVRPVRGALQVLQAFHQAGYLHLDISPDNILLIGEGERERVTLIDYGSVRTFEEIQGPDPVPLTTKDGYTAPEARLGQFSFVGPQTDLFSMTAVFWHCLSGGRLTELEQIGAVLPDPSSLPQLGGCPSTVLSMLRLILRKGLSPSPKKRYRDTSEMLADLSELEDRLSGRGITRWALWESGRARFLRLMRENVSLQYIRDENRVYPLRVESEDGLYAELPGALSAFDDPGPFLLLGGGGIGKTTALFRLAWQEALRGREYREGAAAVFYISLYGYRNGNEHYLLDSLLEGLKFRPETGRLEDARRELMELLNRARPDHPAVFLLLDSYNEAAGDVSPLRNELLLLAASPGARIVLTSRTDPGLPFFKKRTLCRLEPSDVRRILAQEGILPPENPEVFDLLGFPILLSVYIRAVNGGEAGPARLQSRDELLESYFATLRRDSSLEAPEEKIPPARSGTDSPFAVDGKKTSLSDSRKVPFSGADRDAALFKDTDAVFSFLLPEIAAFIRQQECAVTDKELLPVVERCFRELSGRALTAVFPQWIGRTAQLRLGAANADEWYGCAVLDILHRRTGILLRDERGRLRVLHQIMEDYLAKKSRRFHERFDREKRRRKNRAGFVLAAAIFLLLSLFGIYNYRMRRQIEQKHLQMVLSETEAAILDAVRGSEEALAEGKRREAIDFALDAALLSCADFGQAEAALSEEDGLALLRTGLPSIAKKLREKEKPSSGKKPSTGENPSSAENTFAGEKLSAWERLSAWQKLFFEKEFSTGKEYFAPDSYYASEAQNALTEALGVYDMSDGFRPELILYLPSHLSGLCLSPGGTRVCAVCAWDLAVYDTGTGEELAAFPSSDGVAAAVSFSDEDTLLCESHEGLRVYDLNTGEQLREEPAADGSQIFADEQERKLQDKETPGDSLREGFDFFVISGNFCVRGNKGSDTAVVLKRRPRAGTQVMSEEKESGGLALPFGDSYESLPAIAKQQQAFYDADEDDTLPPETKQEQTDLAETVDKSLPPKKRQGQAEDEAASISAPQEFLTDRYRLLSAPQKGIAIYDRETGDDLGVFDMDADASFAVQTGENLLIGYTVPGDRTRFGILLNEYFETIAYLPGLCGFADGEMYFGCEDGSLRKTPVYSLSELIELAAQELGLF